MEFGLDQKVEFKKSFKLYCQNFGKGHNKSCQKCCPLCMAWMKVSEMLEMVCS